MKFEMNGPELETFCQQLGKAHAHARVFELETELSEVRADNESIREDRTYYQQRAEHLSNECDDLHRSSGVVARELNDLRRLVKELQDQLTPNRKERAFSRTFELFRTGMKIPAIKELRAILNVGLKEAKDTVEGNCTDPKFPELIALSSIFAGYRTNSPEVQRQHLAPFVGTASTEQLDSILAGKFHDDSAGAA